MADQVDPNLTDNLANVTAEIEATTSGRPKPSRGPTVRLEHRQLSAGDHRDGTGCGHQRDRMRHPPPNTTYVDIDGATLSGGGSAGTSRRSPPAIPRCAPWCCGSTATLPGAIRNLLIVGTPATRPPCATQRTTWRASPGLDPDRDRMIRRLLAAALVAVVAAGCSGGSGARHPVGRAPVTTPQSSFTPARVAKRRWPPPRCIAPGGAVMEADADQHPADAAEPSCPCSTAGRRRDRTWLRRCCRPGRTGPAAGSPAIRRSPHHSWRVVVSLADRRAVRTSAGSAGRSFPVVIGAPSHSHSHRPVRCCRAIQPPDPNQFYGSWMLTLTAHSNVLDTFAGGDGRVALHGRGGNSLSVPVGHASSHGCVRMRNADIDWLARHAEARTPVVIVRRPCSSSSARRRRGRRSSSAGPGRAAPRGRRDWRAGSGRATGSRSRCTRSGPP